MKKLSTLLLLPFAILFLANCSSISKEECLSGNWQAIGQRDGVKGEGLEKLQKYTKDCADHGVVPNAQQYNVGRNIGLRSFCYNRGNSTGSSGQSSGYISLCSSTDLQSQYTSGYKNGIKSYCTYDNGLSEGRNGYSNNSHLCPASASFEFKKGWKNGIAQYCSSENGFKLGSEGKSSNSSNCPNRLKYAFESAYNSGKKIAQLNAKLSQLEDQLISVDRKLSSSILSDLEFESLQSNFMQKYKLIQDTSSMFSSLGNSSFGSKSLKRKYSLNERFCNPSRMKNYGSRGFKVKKGICKNKKSKRAYKQGLDEYCSPAQAHYRGKFNKKNNYLLCSKNQIPSVIKNYNHGKKSLSSSSVSSSLKSNHVTLKSKRERLIHKIRFASGKEKLRLLAKLKKLDSK